MKIVNVFCTSIMLMFLMLVVSSVTAIAEEDVRDLNSYSCKDVMRLSGSDRDVGIGVLHAYILGKKGTPKFDVSKLSDATDKFIEYCLDNPNDNALTVMETMTK